MYGYMHNIEHNEVLTLDWGMIAVTNIKDGNQVKMLKIVSGIISSFPCSNQTCSAALSSPQCVCHLPVDKTWSQTNITRCRSSSPVLKEVVYSSRAVTYIHPSLLFPSAPAAPHLDQTFALAGIPAVIHPFHFRSGLCLNTLQVRLLL